MLTSLVIPEPRGVLVVALTIAIPWEPQLDPAMLVYANRNKFLRPWAAADTYPLGAGFNHTKFVVVDDRATAPLFLQPLRLGTTTIC